MTAEIVDLNARRFRRLPTPHSALADIASGLPAGTTHEHWLWADWIVMELHMRGFRITPIDYDGGAA
jgi:hypothetical protein